MPSQRTVWAEISEALGVTQQAAHKRFNAAEQRLSCSPTGHKPRCSRRVGKPVAMGHNYVGTEHLLLGVFDRWRRGGGCPQRVERVTEGGRDASPRGARVAHANLGSPWSVRPRATQCVSAGQQRGRCVGHNYVGTEHLLLAVAVDADGLAARVLAELGMNYDDLAGVSRSCPARPVTVPRQICRSRAGRACRSSTRTRDPITLSVEEGERALCAASLGGRTCLDRAFLLLSVTAVTGSCTQDAGCMTRGVANGDLLQAGSGKRRANAQTTSGTLGSLRKERHGRNGGNLRKLPRTAALFPQDAT